MIIKSDYIFLKHLLAILIILLLVGILIYIIGSSCLPGKIILKELNWQYRGIVLYNSFFHTFERITPIDISVFSLAWNPDGKKVTFVYTNSNEQNLHIADMQNGDFRIANVDLISKKMSTIIDHNIDNFVINTETNLAWSPDGKRLMFSAHSGKCNSLYIYDINTKIINSLNRIYCQTLSGDPNYQLTLSWNPGGEPLIGVAENDIPRTKIDDIYILENDLTVQKFLLHGSYPEWKPGENTFSYVCNNPFLKSNALCIYSISESKSDKIIEKFGHNLYAWSPNGESIIFIDTGNEINYTSELTMLSIDTGNSQSLSRLLEIYRNTNYPDTILNKINPFAYQFGSWGGGEILWIK